MAHRLRSQLVPICSTFQMLLRDSREFWPCRSATTFRRAAAGERSQGTLWSMVTCRTCGQSYPEFGDGWDGECPSCADVSFGKEQAAAHPGVEDSSIPGNFKIGTEKTPKPRPY
jgi:hypothetical protein